MLLLSAVPSQPLNNNMSRSTHWRREDSKSKLSQHVDAKEKQESAQSDWLEKLERMVQARAEAAAKKAIEDAEQKRQEAEILRQRDEEIAQAIAEEDARLAALDDGTDIPPWHRGNPLEKPAWLMDMLAKVAEREDADDVYKIYKTPKNLPAKQEITGIKQAANEEANNCNKKFKTPQALPPKKEAEAVKQAARDSQEDVYKKYKTPRALPPKKEAEVVKLALVVAADDNSAKPTTTTTATPVRSCRGPTIPTSTPALSSEKEIIEEEIIEEEIVDEIIIEEEVIDEEITEEDIVDEDIIIKEEEKSLEEAIFATLENSWVAEQAATDPVASLNSKLQSPVHEKSEPDETPISIIDSSNETEVEQSRPETVEEAIFIEAKPAALSTSPINVEASQSKPRRKSKAARKASPEPLSIEVKPAALSTSLINVEASQSKPRRKSKAARKASPEPLKSRQLPHTETKEESTNHALPESLSNGVFEHKPRASSMDDEGKPAGLVTSDQSPTDAPPMETLESAKKLAVVVESVASPVEDVSEKEGLPLSGSIMTPSSIEEGVDKTQASAKSTVVGSGAKEQDAVGKTQDIVTFSSTFDEEKPSYEVPWKNFKLKARIRPEELQASKVQEKLEKRPTLMKPAFVVTKKELKSSKLQEKLENKPELMKSALSVTRDQLASSKVQKKIKSKPAIRKPSFTVSREELTTNKVQEKLANKPDISRMHSAVKGDEMTSMKKKLKPRNGGISLTGPSDLVTSANVDGAVKERPLWMQRTLVLQQSSRELMRDDQHMEQKPYEVPWTNFKLKPRISVEDLKSSEVQEKLEQKPVIRKPSFTISKDELKTNVVQEKLSKKPNLAGMKAVATTKDMVLMKEKLKPQGTFSLLGPSDLVSSANMDDSITSEKPLWMQRTLVLQQSTRDLITDANSEENEYEAPWLNYKLKAPSVQQ